MMGYSIIVLIVLINIIFSHGHTLSKIKLNNLTDVYEVKEGESTLTLTNPRPEKPTLREIMYYHMVERAYGRSDEVDDGELETDITRPFTNSHGYQFLEDDEKNDSKYDHVSVASIDDGEKETADDDENEDEDENENEDENEDENVDKDDNENVDKDVDENENSDDKDIKPTIVAVTKKLEVETIVTISEELQKAKIESTTAASAAPATNKNEVIEEKRRKRDIDYTNLHDGPALPEFKLDILPDFIKAIISAEPKTKENTQNYQNFEKLENQVAPSEQEASNEAADHQDTDKEDGIDKTYGMSLAGDGGVVWNELQKKGSYSYHVGEPSETILRPDNESEVTSVEEVLDSEGDEEIEASFNNIEGLFQEIVDSITEVNTDDATDQPDEDGSIGETTTKNIDLQYPNESSKEIPDINDTDNDDKPKESETVNIEPIDSSEKIPDDKDFIQQKFVQDLMKNNYFWQWLKDTSKNYVKILIEKLDILIKAEVEKQIEQYFDDHKDNFICKPEVIINNEHSTSNDSVETSAIVDEISEISKETNGEENDTNAEEPEVVSDESENEKEIMAKRKDKEPKDKQTDTPVKIQAQNVYGNSVGNGEVTNIFIFNISKMSDLEYVKPLSNGTNGIYAFGVDKKTEADKIGEKKDVGENPEDKNPKPIEYESVNAVPQNDKETKQPLDNSEVSDSSVSNIKVTAKEPNTVEIKYIIEQVTDISNSKENFSNGDSVSERDNTEFPNKINISQTENSTILTNHNILM